MIYINGAVKFIQLLQKYNINIDALQLSLTYVIKCIYPNYNKATSIRFICRKCKANYGIYEFAKRRIVICNTVNSKELLLQTIMHEFKHWIQHNIEHISPNMIIDNSVDYEHNKYEQQCVAFENLYKQLEQLLDIHENIRTIF